MRGPGYYGPNRDAEIERLKDELARWIEARRLAEAESIRQNGEIIRLRAELAARPVLGWTTEEPKASAWYWVKQREVPPVIKFWVRGIYGKDMQGVRWAGPIHEPAEPGGGE